MMRVRRRMRRRRRMMMIRSGAASQVQISFELWALESPTPVSLAPGQLWAIF
jgi:hypothetical protein